jgi:hypothetical protein
MYFLLSKYKGEWIVGQNENLQEAERLYRNQCTKLDGWGMTDVILIEGKVLKSLTETEVLKSKGYPR